MKRIPIRKMLAAVSAAVMTALTVLPVCANADGTEPSKKIVVLGDSIARGYGLRENEPGFYDYLGRAMDASVTNLGVDGLTTAGLLEKLSDSAVQDALKDADQVYISIGGNDLMSAARTYFEPMREENESTLHMLQRLSDVLDITQVIAGLTGALRQPKADAQANYPLIEEAVRSVNSTADVFYLTIYNPLEISEKRMDENELSTAERASFDQFVRYVNGNLNQLNRTMRDLTANIENSDAVDVYAAFKDTSYLYVRSDENDVHPNMLGHAMIAALVMEKYQLSNIRFDEFVTAMENIPLDYYPIFPNDDHALLDHYAGATSRRFGDINDDKIVNVNDAIETLVAYNYAIMEEDYSLTYGDFYNGDVDGDRQLTTWDAIAILTYFNMVEVMGDTETTWYSITENPFAPDAPAQPAS